MVDGVPWPSVLTCRCNRSFEGADDFQAWEKHRQHAVAETLKGDGGMHDVVVSSKPFTYPDRPGDGDLRDLVVWMAQTVHQTYHDEAGTFETCNRPICVEAVLGLWKDIAMRFQCPVCFQRYLMPPVIDQQVMEHMENRHNMVVDAAWIADHTTERKT